MEGVPQLRGGAEVLGDPKLDLRCVCVCVCARYRTKLGYDKKGGLILALAPCFCTFANLFLSTTRERKGVPDSITLCFTSTFFFVDMKEGSGL